MKRIFALISIVGIASCATSKTVHLPSGEKGHSLNCSGTALTWGNCYEKAGKLCGEAGYDIVSKSGDQGSTVAANQYGLYGGSVINRSMLVKCKSGS